MECFYSDDDTIQLYLLKTFPLILPQNKHLSHYDGFMNIGGRQLRLTIDVPNYPSVEGMQLIPDWELEAILADRMAAVNKLSGRCGSIPEYMEELKEILETCVSIKDNKLIGQNIPVNNASTQLKSLGSDDLILSQLRSLGFDHVSALEADLRTVSFIARDEYGNRHEMSLKISANYPDVMNSEPVFNVINTDLPRAVCELIQKECNIPAAFRCFSQQLSNLSSIWNELQLLDDRVWVIDPTHPKKSDMYRRIFIDAPKVMAQITWNPTQPLNKPDIMFQGAEYEVESFRNIYELHLEEWSSSCDILVNMCKVLNLSELPGKQASTDDVNTMHETGECCICMSADFNGVLPSVSCGKCLSCFHASCLFQWLEMLGKSRVVHNHISGDCPNCETEIKCPDPNSTDMA